MEIIIIHKSRPEIRKIEDELRKNPKITHCFKILNYDQWFKFKERYLINREDIILLMPLEDKKNINCSIKLIKQYYRQIYIIKSDLKDYCLSYIKQGIIKIYESV